MGKGELLGYAVLYLVQKPIAGLTAWAKLPRMSIAELRKLPSEEKMRIIEALWGDVAADDEAFPSPAWHEGELRETEAKFESGQIEAVDWNAAKRELRGRFE